MGTMNKETFKQAYDEIYNFREKLGEVVYDAINEEDNYPRDMAKYIIDTFHSCQTEREFNIADEMLTAICGWNFETLVERIRQRDADPDFYWESCDKKVWIGEDD